MPAAAVAAKVENSNHVCSAMFDVHNSKGKMPVDLNNCGQDPTKIANTIIEKKIRNLEKRKTRLLEMKAMEDKGQKLEPDQKNAIKKLDSVVEMVDMLKEINKNVSDCLNDFAKQQKKQQKKEFQEKQLERQQNEMERVKLWLNLQFILPRLSTSVKKDLLEGGCHRVRLENKQADALEKLSQICPLRSVDSLEESAEKINYLLDGNKKEFTTGVTYTELRDLLLKLIESKYFDKIPLTLVSSAVGDSETPDKVDVAETVKSTAESKSEVNDDSTNVDSNGALKISFMRDPVIESELRKDPAVVASGLVYQPQLAQPALSTTSASNFPTVNSTNRYSHIYPAAVTFQQGSIPTQTFTNQTYAALIPNPNPFIPVTLPTTIPHAMSFPVEQANIPVRNATEPVAVAAAESSNSIGPQGDETSDSSKATQGPVESQPVVNGNSISFMNPSQDNEVQGNNNSENGNTNGGHPYRRNGIRNGNPRGMQRGNYNNARPRASGKFNNSGGSFNNNNNGGNRSNNRHNGSRPGAYRGGHPGRNQLNNSYNQGQNTAITSK